jgi:hypothetical protein
MRKFILIALLGVFGSAQADIIGFQGDYAAEHWTVDIDGSGTASFSAGDPASLDALTLTTPANFDPLGFGGEIATTQITTTATADGTVGFSWSLSLIDPLDLSFDPFIFDPFWDFQNAISFLYDGDGTLLSDPSDFSIDYSVANVISGSFAFEVLADDTFGFLLDGFDSFYNATATINMFTAPGSPNGGGRPNGNVVPEPSIIALFSLGLVGLGLVRRRRLA